MNGDVLRPVNDDIPIPGNKTTPDIKLVAIGFQYILEGLGLNPANDPHLKDTPQRAARAWYHELCRSLTSEKELKITTFPTESHEMVLLKGIPIRSLCSHHLLPFYGTATIAYIPGTKCLLGLSKLSRIANHYARRPQVQEELTGQIADAIAKVVVTKKPSNEPITHLDPPRVTLGGAGVVIEAEHLCMAMRGVNHEAHMVTSALRGVFFEKPEVRAEFLRLANP